MQEHLCAGYLRVASSTRLASMVIMSRLLASLLSYLVLVSVSKPLPGSYLHTTRLFTCQPVYVSISDREPC